MLLLPSQRARYFCPLQSYCFTTTLRCVGNLVITSFEEYARITYPITMATQPIYAAELAQCVKDTLIKTHVY